MDYFAINNNSYFEHHGRKGQKWGDRNGPPYPLDYSKLSDEERQEAKTEAIDKGDIETAAAYKNREYFTKQELDNLINRYQTNQRLDELVKSENAKKVKDGMAKVEKIIRVAGTISSGIKTGSELVNNVNNLMNALDRATQNKMTKNVTETLDEKTGKRTVSTKDFNTGKTTIKISNYVSEEQKKALEKEKRKTAKEKKASAKKAAKSKSYQVKTNSQVDRWKEQEAAQKRKEQEKLNNYRFKNKSEYDYAKAMAEAKLKKKNVSLEDIVSESNYQRNIRKENKKAQKERKKLERMGRVLK